MSLIDIYDIGCLKNEKKEYEEQISKLKKKIKNPFVADIVFALSTSATLNFVANLHDHYSFLEYLKYCLIDAPGYMPVGLIISYYIYELNKEKKEEIKKLSDKLELVNRRLEELKDVECYYDYLNSIIESNIDTKQDDVVVRKLNYNR